MENKVSLSQLKDYEINLRVADYFLDVFFEVSAGATIIFSVEGSMFKFNPCNSWDDTMAIVERIDATIKPVCNLAYIEDENEVRVIEVENPNVKRAVAELYLLAIDEGFVP